MVDTETVEQVADAEAEAHTDPAALKRSRSTIEFPYNDLDEAVKVAQAIRKDWGQGCTLDQLAASIGKTTSTKSGAFRLKVSTARIFGLIEIDRGRIMLTALGLQIVDADQHMRARGLAFLHVPLYRKVFVEYKGQLLPRAIALENEFVRFGVAVKQKDKARQVFQRAAEQAGFSAMGRDRLIAPAGVNTDNGAVSASVPAAQPSGSPAIPGEDDRLKNQGGGGSGGGGGELPPLMLHPAIHGLLLTMPHAGAVWPADRRKKWLDTLAAVLGFVYPDPPAK